MCENDVCILANHAQQRQYGRRALTRSEVGNTMYEDEV